MYQQMFIGMYPIFTLYQRISVGVLLIILAALSTYYQQTRLLLVFSLLSSMYDIIYLKVKTKVNRFFILILFFFILYVHFISASVWIKRPDTFIKIVSITQLSDIYQFFVGYLAGNHRIGWISRNKTYEGYFGGLILTVVTFLPFYNAMEITLIYTWGIIGGLISSLVKRALNIKDYSNFLGPHGGWIDRTDSIILPMIIMYTFIRKAKM